MSTTRDQFTEGCVAILSEIVAPTIVDYLKTEHNVEVSIRELVNLFGEVHVTKTKTVSKSRSTGETKGKCAWILTRGANMGSNCQNNIYNNDGVSLHHCKTHATSEKDEVSSMYEAGTVEYDVRLDLIEQKKAKKGAGNKGPTPVSKSRANQRKRIEMTVKSIPHPDLDTVQIDEDNIVVSIEPDIRSSRYIAYGIYDENSDLPGKIEPITEQYSDILSERQYQTAAVHQLEALFSGKPVSYGSGVPGLRSIDRTPGRTNGRPVASGLRSRVPDL